MKKSMFGVVFICTLIGSLAFASAVAYAKPRQTKQGCQTEAADYLVDIIWVEFGSGIYSLDEGTLRAMLQSMGASSVAEDMFADLILAGGTVIGYFGPCCFEGGPKKYVDARQNTFPTGCCKSPDFAEFSTPRLFRRWRWQSMLMSIRTPPHTRGTNIR
jgi:hypothetical protein